MKKSREHYLHARQAVVIAAAASRTVHGRPLSKSERATLVGEMISDFERRTAKAALRLLDGQRLALKTDADKAADILVGWSSRPRTPQPQKKGRVLRSRA